GTSTEAPPASTFSRASPSDDGRTTADATAATPAGSTESCASAVRSRREPSANRPVTATCCLPSAPLSRIPAGSACRAITPGADRAEAGRSAAGTHTAMIQAGTIQGRGGAGTTVLLGWGESMAAGAAGGGASHSFGRRDRPVQGNRLAEGTSSKG